EVADDPARGGARRRPGAQPLVGVRGPVSGAPAHDVAAVLVNYNSGALCVEAVRSLRAQSFPGGRLQIVVVDNASPEDQRAPLAPLADLDVDVVFHDQTLGYGGGMNLGLRRVDARHVLLSNPDVLALDGALDAM